MDYLHPAHTLGFHDHLNGSDEQLHTHPSSSVFVLPDLLASGPRYAQAPFDLNLSPALEQTTNAASKIQQGFSAIHHPDHLPAAERQPLQTDAKPAKLVNIFISYVKEDRKILEGLQKHLRVMQRQLERRNYAITIWHSGQVIPGQDWKEKIEHYLSTAHIILLLVSIDFLDSELCYAIQIQPALDRHELGTACVIPVILRPCDWEEELFGRLQALPTDGVPIVNWPIADEAYKDIITGIRQAIADLPA